MMEMENKNDGESFPNKTRQIQRHRLRNYTVTILYAYVEYTSGNASGFFKEGGSTCIENEQYLRKTGQLAIRTFAHR